MNDTSNNEENTFSDGYFDSITRSKLFGMSPSTAPIEKDILQAKDIKTVLKRHQDKMLSTLSDYLGTMLYQKDMKVADVIRDSGLTKSYVHQIFNGQKMPSRDKLIAIAFGLHLPIQDTQRMLKIGGCSELYARIPRDAVIMFAIIHEMTIWEADALLYENNFPTLLKED